MPITIHVQNFQSIADATLVVDGFTSITGPNNTGKSAFVRAVQGLFCNAKGNSFVRRGAEYCTVKITFNDGVSVTWEKGNKGINRYRINEGEWLEKVSHGVPEEVEEVLNVRALQVGSTTFWPQIGEQFTGQVFLLDKPKSVMAEAISDVERVGKLNKALSLAESDKRKARSTLKIRRSDEERIEERLLKFHGLDDVGRAIDDIQPLYAQANKAKQALLELLRLQESLQQEAETIRRLSGVEDISLPDKDTLEEAVQSYREYQELQSLQRDMKSSREEVASLSRVVAAFDGVDWGEEDEAAFTKAAKSLAVLVQLKESLQKSAEEVREVLAAMESLAREVSEAESAVMDMLSEMDECPVCGTEVAEKGALNHVH